MVDLRESQRNTDPCGFGISSIHSVYPPPRMPIAKEGLGWDSPAKNGRIRKWWLLLDGGVVPIYTHVCLEKNDAFLSVKLVQVSTIFILHKLGLVFLFPGKSTHQAILHPWILTWNLKMEPWKKRFLSKTIIFWLYVSLLGCNSV